MSQTHALDPLNPVLVRIKDKGEIRELDYDGAMAKHTNTLWWGTAVGFRAMQVAAKALSEDGLWSRDDLYVVSAHPGPGVRDSINYITDTVGRDRYKVFLDDTCGMKCNSAMKFEWWVSDGRRTVSVRLRQDFVPASFYRLVDRLGTDEETEEDTHNFEIAKVNMSARIWATPLERNFTATMLDKPLAPGELPSEMQRKDYWDDLVTRQPATA
jgi:hypothetical protein